MAKGRKSIPSKIIDLRGGTKHTHKKPREDEPSPPENIPPCPETLDKNARAEWRRAGKLLDAVGLLSDLDMAVLAAYCVAYSKWMDAIEESGAIKKIEADEKIDLKKYSSRVVDYHTEYQSWAYATKDILENGVIIIKDGIPGRNKILGLQREAGDRMAKIRRMIERNLHDRHEEMHKNMTLIGLSPANRVGLKVSQPKGKSKAEQFMDRKNGAK